MERRNRAKRRNLSQLEMETLTSQVQFNQLVLFGSLKSDIKVAVWKEITAVVNSIAVDKRTPAEVEIFSLYIHDKYQSIAYI